MSAARAAAATARWQFYPTPSASVEAARASASDIAYQGDAAVTTLRVQQPIWTGGRLTAGVDKARAGVSASRASFDEVRQQLALRVIQAYGDWWSSALKAQATQKSLLVHDRLLAQVRRRISQGVSADSDSVLAQSRLQTLAAEHATAGAQQEVALGRLTQLVGYPVEASALSATVAVARPLPVGAREAIDRAVSASPSVQRAQAEAEVRRVEVNERQAALLPEVFVRAERQHGNASVSNSAPVNRVFFGVSTSFGAGLSGLTNIDAAKAQHQASLAEVQVQARAVGEQVVADHALAASVDQRLQALGMALVAAQAVSDSFDRQFLAGRKTWLDVMNAARELSQIELQIAEARSAQVVLTWRLAILAGGVEAVLGTGR